MSMPKLPDRILLSIVIVFVVVGFLIFSSASLGLLARDGVPFTSVAANQFLFGIVGGSIVMFLASSIHYRTWRQYAFYFFVATLILTLLVFVPGLGFEHAGAKRWIAIGGFSFQPAEFLKLGFVVYMATWLSGMKDHVGTFVQGTLPFLGIVGVVGVVMLLQPDTDTYAIMVASAMAMFLTAGGKIRDVVGIVLVGVCLILVLAFMRPYIMDRLTTFMDPSSDPLGSGYQINQSLIAIGSGGAFGRGFGQSIQKFEYLPEPIGDSIFAVFAEEFGFMGGALLVLLFAAFTFRGFRIATHAPDLFGMLLVVGFVTIITLQAFLNMAAMVAVAPLSGLPLPFISHGGTALMATLASIGIVLNVSRYQKARPR